MVVAYLVIGYQRDSSCLKLVASNRFCYLIVGASIERAQQQNA
jgi:hypothetical protein